MANSILTLLDYSIEGKLRINGDVDLKLIKYQCVNVFNTYEVVHDPGALDMGTISWFFCNPTTEVVLGVRIGDSPGVELPQLALAAFQGLTDDISYYRYIGLLGKKIYFKSTAPLTITFLAGKQKEITR